METRNPSQVLSSITLTALKGRSTYYKWLVRIHGLMRRTCIEVRITDTQTGKEHVQYVESDIRGIAKLAMPTFSEKYQIAVRVLASEHYDILHHLHFTNIESDYKYVMQSDTNGV